MRDSIYNRFSFQHISQAEDMWYVIKYKKVYVQEFWVAIKSKDLPNGLTTTSR